LECRQGLHETTIFSTIENLISILVIKKDEDRETTRIVQIFFFKKKKEAWRKGKKNRQNDAFKSKKNYKRQNNCNECDVVFYFSES